MAEEKYPIFKSGGQAFDRSKIEAETMQGGRASLEAAAEDIKKAEQVVAEIKNFYNEAFDLQLKAVDPAYDPKAAEYRYAYSNKGRNLKKLQDRIEKGEAIDGKEIEEIAKQDASNKVANAGILKTGSVTQIIEAIGGTKELENLDSFDGVKDEFDSKVKDEKNGFEVLLEKLSQQISLLNEPGAAQMGDKIFTPEINVIIASVAKILKEEGFSSESVNFSSSKFDERIGGFVKNTPPNQVESANQLEKREEIKEKEQDKAPITIEQKQAEGKLGVTAQENKQIEGNTGQQPIEQKKETEVPKEKLESTQEQTKPTSPSPQESPTPEPVATQTKTELATSQEQVEKKVEPAKEENKPGEENKVDQNVVVGTQAGADLLKSLFGGLLGTPTPSQSREKVGVSLAESLLGIAPKTAAGATGTTGATGIENRSPTEKKTPDVELAETALDIKPKNPTGTTGPNPVTTPGSIESSSEKSGTTKEQKKSETSTEKTTSSSEVVTTPTQMSEKGDAGIGTPKKQETTSTKETSSTNTPVSSSPQSPTPISSSSVNPAGSSPIPDTQNTTTTSAASTITNPESTPTKEVASVENSVGNKSTQTEGQETKPIEFAQEPEEKSGFLSKLKRVFRKEEEESVGTLEEPESTKTVPPESTMVSTPQTVANVEKESGSKDNLSSVEGQATPAATKVPEPVVNPQGMVEAAGAPVAPTPGAPAPAKGTELVVNPQGMVEAAGAPVAPTPGAPATPATPATPAPAKGSELVVNPQGMVEAAGAPVAPTPGAPATPATPAPGKGAELVVNPQGMVEAVNSQTSKVAPTEVNKQSSSPVPTGSPNEVGREKGSETKSMIEPSKEVAGILAKPLLGVTTQKSSGAVEPSKGGESTRPSLLKTIGQIFKRDEKKEGSENTEKQQNAKGTGDTPPIQGNVINQKNQESVNPNANATSQIEGTKDKENVVENSGAAKDISTNEEVSLEESSLVQTPQQLGQSQEISLEDKQQAQTSTVVGETSPMVSRTEEKLQTQTPQTIESSEEDTKKGVFGRIKKFFSRDKEETSKLEETKNAKPKVETTKSELQANQTAPSSSRGGSIEASNEPIPNESVSMGQTMVMATSAEKIQEKNVTEAETSSSPSSIKENTPQKLSDVIVPEKTATETQKSEQKIREEQAQSKSNDTPTSVENKGTEQEKEATKVNQGQQNQNQENPNDELAKKMDSMIFLLSQLNDTLSSPLLVTPTTKKFD